MRYYVLEIDSDGDADITFATFNYPETFRALIKAETLSELHRKIKKLLDDVKFTSKSNHQQSVKDLLKAVKELYKTFDMLKKGSEHWSDWAYGGNRSISLRQLFENRYDAIL